MRRADRVQQVMTAAREAGWGWDGRTCLHMLVEAAEAVAPARGARAAAAALGGGRMPSGRGPVLRALAGLGGLEAAVAACAARCGFPEIDPDLAASGDWGVAHLMGDAAAPGHAEGVLRVGDAWVYRIPDAGVVEIPAALAPVSRAWAVG